MSKLNLSSKLYGVNATILIFVFVLYCIDCIILDCIILYCIILYCIVFVIKKGTLDDGFYLMQRCQWYIANKVIILNQFQSHGRKTSRL